MDIYVLLSQLEEVIHNKSIFVNLCPVSALKDCDFVFISLQRASVICKGIVQLCPLRVFFTPHYVNTPKLFLQR